jgi:hypothetical protein
MTRSSRSIASKETPSPLPGAPNVKVVLWHFHRSRYRSLAMWFFVGGGALVSWSLAMDEHGGYEDLRGSGRRSVIPYVHRRIELYCSSLSCLSLSFRPPSVKMYLPGPFIAQGQVITMRSGARQVASRWLKPYTTSRVIGVANDILHDVSIMESSCFLTLLY